MFFFFFFQAEDGIRDIGVTGVQTCALPISRQRRLPGPHPRLPGGPGGRGGRDRSSRVRAQMAHPHEGLDRGRGRGRPRRGPPRAGDRRGPARGAAPPGRRPGLSAAPLALRRARAGELARLAALVASPAVAPFVAYDAAEKVERALDREGEELLVVEVCRGAVAGGLRL